MTAMKLLDKMEMLGLKQKNLFSSIYRIRLFCLTEIVFRYFYLLFGLVDVLFLLHRQSFPQKTTDLTFWILLLPYSCPPYSGLAVPVWITTSRFMLHLPVVPPAGRDKGNHLSVRLEREHTLDSSDKLQDRFWIFIPTAHYLPTLLNPLRCKGER